MTLFSELRQLVGWNQVYLPIAKSLPEEDLLQSAKIFATTDRQVRLHVSFGHGDRAMNFDGDEIFSGRCSPHVNSSRMAALITYDSPSAQPNVNVSNYKADATIGEYFTPFRNRVYRFNAQRKPGTQCGAVGTFILDREAAALPYCVNHLQTNDAHGHRLLCEWVSRVFPNVKWIQAPPVGGNFQLRCLPLPPETRRDDLSIPLSRMGTGIGNIIAMLYVVLTSRDPQVIAIDEPNAFLHPRALRELLAILESEGKQHQFILTAHSADVLTSVSARSISLLEFNGTATTVKRVDRKDLHSVRGALAELGIRVTDLHAKDRVLWVEGQTEELVMPDLLRWACPEVAAGTAVLRVERTGTFSRRGIVPEEVAQIYERLSSSSALVPAMVCILLDGEKLSVEKRAAIAESSQGKLRFLDRRMIENYLLDPEGVAAALLELGESTTTDLVQSALCKSLGLNNLLGNLTEVDGAAALKRAFSELSESRQEFRKTRDVPTITNWIIENHPERLAPLVGCLRASFGLKQL